MRFLPFVLAVFAVQPVLSAPYGLAPTSNLSLPVGFKCKMVDGKLVCGDFGTGEKKNDKDDDDDDDDDDNKPKKKEKKQQGGGTGLSDCTIQDGGGGGCKTGFKRVCEKLKSGKKCCGCVVDPNAPAAPEKCKLPGQVGTPPNCSCPPMTDLVGNACVRYSYKEAYCKNFTTPGGGFNTQASTDMAVQCKATGGYAECKTTEKCCCNVKAYAQ